MIDFPQMIKRIRDLTNSYLYHSTLLTFIIYIKAINKAIASAIIGKLSKYRDFPKLSLNRRCMGSLSCGRVVLTIELTKYRDFPKLSLNPSPLNRRCMGSLSCGRVVLSNFSSYD